MKKLATFSLAALLLSSTSVLAQSMMTFDELDSDGDDKLSYSDLLSHWPDLTQEQFDAADIDSDTFLDLTQFEALQVEMGASSSTEVAVAVEAPAIEAPLFENVDSDGNGKVSFDDLTGWGLIQADFDAADIDSDKFLDVTEYEGIKAKMIAPAAEAEIAVGAVGSSNNGLPLFEEVDADGDGQIAFSDLKVALPDVTQEQFDSADVDNDDFLDRTQYEGLEM